MRHVYIRTEIVCESIIKQAVGNYMRRTNLQDATFFI